MRLQEFRRAWVMATALATVWTICVDATRGQGCDVTQEAKFVASDSGPGDLFGNWVSLDGDSMIVGAPLDNDAGTDSGSAYVFVRSGGVWTQEAKITANDAAANDQFGYRVAISGDTVLVGAVQDGDAGMNSGSAYVFVRADGSWTQQQKLTASDAAAADTFGISVAVDGDTAVVGAYNHGHAGMYAGAAYVFVRSAGVWTQQAELNAVDAQPNQRFGRSVSINGGTVAVGTYGESAYIFVRSGTTWMQETKLVAADGQSSDSFGVSVAIDGDAVVIGAFSDQDAGFSAGSAYAFVRSTGVPVWTQQGKLIGADTSANDGFGISVTISGDTAVVGAIRNDNTGGSDAGSAYAFELDCEGACCVRGACANVRQVACDAYDGVYFSFGSGAFCNDVTCPSICGADIIPCPSGDGVVDIFDILGVLDGFEGEDCCTP
ncbi:MAG: hypothetical protein HOP29_10940 [Phycisphaerales bacterium]|nr:hypothetical protein [Phycisphaerales bacterium]